MMTECAHRWMLFGAGKAPDFTTKVFCANGCDEVMDVWEIERRLNATERLSIVTIMGLVGLLEHDYAVSFSEYKEELRAYYAELEGTDAD